MATEVGRWTGAVAIYSGKNTTVWYEYTLQARINTAISFHSRWVMIINPGDGQWTQEADGLDIEFRCL